MCLCVNMHVYADMYICTRYVCLYIYVSHTYSHTHTCICLCLQTLWVFCITSFTQPLNEMYWGHLRARAQDKGDGERTGRGAMSLEAPERGQGPCH